MRRITRFSSKRSELLFRTMAILLPLITTVLLLSQSAFAQNTYVITDGERVLVHTTSTTDPKAVLDEAGLALGDDDTYTTQGGDGVSEITVRRYLSLQINHCGQMLTVDNATTETVESLLNRLGIVLDENTTVSAPMDAMTYDGMKLSITRTIHNTETYTKAIPYETTYYNDPALPEGTRLVISEGTYGEMIYTADVTYRNGEEVNRNIVKQILSRQSVPQVIALGTGLKTESPLAAENTVPPEGNISSEEESVPETEVEEEFIPEILPEMRPTPEYPIIGNGTITTATGEVLTYTDTMSVLASAYTNTDEGCDAWTATGTLARVGAIAVDPSVIPYGTRMFIVSDDGVYIYGLATAEDCGGAINGNRVDLYFDTTAECFRFGMRNCTIYFLG